MTKEDTSKNLTAREMEVLELLSSGLNNNEIAQTLIISSHTVKAHVASILDKMKVKNRICAAVKYVNEIHSKY